MDSNAPIALHQPPSRLDPQHTIQRVGDTIRLGGELRLRNASALWFGLNRAAEGKSKTLVFDLGGVRAVDGGVMALLVELRSLLEARGVTSEITGANPGLEPVVALYNGQAGATGQAKRTPEGTIAHIGRATVAAIDEAKSLLDFFGSLTLAGWALVRHPRSGNWKEIAPLCEKTGADAIPIVLLINFLVGFVMAFQSAKQLKVFGANIYVADLVGISLTRELAPLMTAIIVCGRSGAAFAAELGSMKVNEELDALRTLGLSPFGWLVVPRLMALMLVEPALTLIADFSGVTGGVLVGIVDLDLTARGYFLVPTGPVESHQHRGNGSPGPTSAKSWPSLGESGEDRVSESRIG